MIAPTILRAHACIATHLMHASITSASARTMRMFDIRKFQSSSAAHTVTTVVNAYCCYIHQGDDNHTATTTQI